MFEQFWKFISTDKIKFYTINNICFWHRCCWFIKLQKGCQYCNFLYECPMKISFALYIIKGSSSYFSKEKINWLIIICANGRYFWEVFLRESKSISGVSVIFSYSIFLKIIKKNQRTRFLTDSFCIEHG